MKRINLFVLTFLLSLNSGFTAEWQFHFQNGNRDYAEGKYQQAIEEYSQIINFGYESGELYFNLGNAYYKLDEIGKAILCYEKAKLYMENDESLIQNLEIARLKVIDKIEPVPELFLNIWWRKIVHLFSINHNHP